MNKRGTGNSKSKDVKVVLLGDSGVGKSSILLRFVANEFKPGCEPTLGAAFLSQMLKYNDIDYKFQIWDTAGQEKYKSLAPLYYRDSQVALVVYDITHRNSFEVLKQWIFELRQHGPEDIIIAIVGNKYDLIEREQIKDDEARQYASELFQNIADTLEQREKRQQNVTDNQPNKSKLSKEDTDKNRQNKKKGCC